MTKNWQWIALGDVLVAQANRKKLQQGWSPKCHDYAASTGEWAVLKTTAIQAGHFEPQHNKALPSHFEPKPGIMVRAGDLLITCAGPRTRCGVPTLVRSTPERLMMSGKMYRFRADDRVDPRFLELWLLSPDAQRQIDAMKTGISDSGLNLTHDRFTRLPVPVPPLNEQRRIVDLLEDHLSRLEAGTALLEHGESETVAVQEAWLKSKFPQRRNTDSLRLKDVLQSVRGGWSRSARHLVAPNQGVPYLKMNNLTRRGRLDLRDVVRVEADQEALLKFGVRPGDVLFNSKNSGDLIGKTTIVDSRASGSVINENIMRLRFDARVVPEFAAISFLGPQLRQCIVEAASASTNVAAVYQKDLLTFPIWLPELPEQYRLVAEFDAVRGGAERLQDQLVLAHRRAELLRKALLKEAFSGRLTSDAKSSSLQATTRD